MCLRPVRPIKFLWTHPRLVLNRFRFCTRPATNSDLIYFKLLLDLSEIFSYTGSKFISNRSCLSLISTCFSTFPKHFGTCFGFISIWPSFVPDVQNCPNLVSILGSEEKTYSEFESTIGNFLTQYALFLRVKCPVMKSERNFTWKFKQQFSAPI